MSIASKQRIPGLQYWSYDMKKTKARIGIIVLVVIIAIQFWPVERTNPPVLSDIEAPQEVKAVLHAACYDCHSNETRWPWYSYVAPASWLVTSDVTEAREHLNLSEWPSDARDRAEAAEHMWKHVKDGEMPLFMYRVAHSEARLSESQKQIIRNWAESPQQ
jgi:hypothetical protein